MLEFNQFANKKKKTNIRIRMKNNWQQARGITSFIV